MTDERRTKHDEQHRDGGHARERVHVLLEVLTLDGDAVFELTALVDGLLDETLNEPGRGARLARRQP